MAHRPVGRDLAEQPFRRQEGGAPFGVDHPVVAGRAELRRVPEALDVQAVGDLLELDVRAHAVARVVGDRAVALRGHDEVPAGAHDAVHLLQPAQRGASAEVRPDRNREDDVECLVGIGGGRPQRAAPRTRRPAGARAPRRSRRGSGRSPTRRPPAMRPPARARPGPRSSRSQGPPSPAKAAHRRPPARRSPGRRSSTCRRRPARRGPSRGRPRAARPGSTRSSRAHPGPGGGRRRRA